MNIVAWIVGIVVAVVFAGGGVAKIVDLDRARERLGYTSTEFRLIGAAELLGAIGVVVGLIWTKIEWVGHATGVGLASLTLAALMAHARAGDDGKKAIPAAVMFGVVVLYMIFLAVR